MSVIYFYFTPFFPYLVNPNLVSAKHWIKAIFSVMIGYILMVLITWVTKILLEYCAINSIITDKNILSLKNIFLSYTSPTIVLASYFLINLFSNLVFKEKLKNLISKISPLTFSVYLIHEHPLIRSLFIKKKFISYGRLSLSELYLKLV